MSRPVIVVGDRTSHGGVVLTGSPFSDVDGKGIARIGDTVSCPKKGHGSVTTIVTGDVTDIIDGSPVARHGDKTACGAILISSQMLTYVDEGSDGGREGAGAGAASATVARQAVPSKTEGSEAEGFDQQFLLTDEVTGEPLANRFYRLTWNGKTIDGNADDEGLTKRVEADAAVEVRIEIFPEGYKGGVA